MAKNDLVVAVEQKFITYIILYFYSNYHVIIFLRLLSDVTLSRNCDTVVIGSRTL